MSNDDNQGISSEVPLKVYAQRAMEHVDINPVLLSAEIREKIENIRMFETFISGLKSDFDNKRCVFGMKLMPIDLSKMGEQSKSSSKSYLRLYDNLDAIDDLKNIFSCEKEWTGEFLKFADDLENGDVELGQHFYETISNLVDAEYDPTLAPRVALFVHSLIAEAYQNGIDLTGTEEQEANNIRGVHVEDFAHLQNGS